MAKKALVLFSGGLDSRLAVRIMQEKGYQVEALHFILPFVSISKKKPNNYDEYCEKQRVPLNVIDVTRNGLLQDYISMIKMPKYGRGTGLNPCTDCKIWMFRKAKEFADKNSFDVIATGEVLGQRPMSQTTKKMKIIDKELGFRICRPLIEIGIRGRNRTRQVELAKKYNISYPQPAGGCLLCEKEMKNKLKRLIDENVLDEDSLSLIHIKKHYIINGQWFVIARNEQESAFIEKFKNSVESNKGIPAIYYHNPDTREMAVKIQNDFKDREKRKEYDKYKL